MQLCEVQQTRIEVTLIICTYCLIRHMCSGASAWCPRDIPTDESNDDDVSEVKDPIFMMM